MFALAINGSPRQGGNTEALVDHVLKPHVHDVADDRAGIDLLEYGAGVGQRRSFQDAEGLNNMDNLGETIAWLGQAMQPHMASFPDTKAPLNK